MVSELFKIDVEKTPVFLNCYQSGKLMVYSF